MKREFRKRFPFFFSYTFLLLPLFYRHNISLFFGMSKIHIGTSGWLYWNWKGIFYPEDLSSKDYFSFYQKHFDTVELNYPFYHVPKKETFLKWKNAVDKNFIYAVKANRYITHVKKLAEAPDAIKFLDHAKALEKNLGPILFQLPPSWKINAERFKNFLEILPKKFRYTFEFRNSTWYDEKIYSLLQKYNCAFCIYDLDKHQSPEIVTADFVYVRLHGTDGKYRGSYSGKILSDWAMKCHSWRRKGKDVFFYFDNTYNGDAVRDALQLKKLLEKKKFS